MPTPQSSFVIKHYDGFGGNFLDSQYLGKSFDAANPVKLEKAIMKIFASKNRFFTGSKLLSQMAMSTSLREIDGEVWDWLLQGAEYKTARVLEVVESSTTPGLGLTTFRVKLDLDYFDTPDVLMAESAEYTTEIVSKMQDGTGTIYTLKLQGDDPTRFLPVEYLQPGKRWDKVWTAVSSEFNEVYGTQQVPSSMKLRNQLGYFAQKITVTDKAVRDSGRLSVEFMVDNKIVRNFLSVYEARMMSELYEGVEAALVYGKKETRPGHNGYAIRTGSGLREQLKDGWDHYYNGVLTAALMRDYVMDVFFARENEDNRDVVFMTGTLGSIIFHEALANLANGFLSVDSNFIGKDAPNVGPTQGLRFGAQYTRYLGPTGIDITLYTNPMYDSEKYCKISHPMYPNMPIDSARMTALNFGTSQGVDNIQMIKEKNSFSHGHVSGMIGPNGPVTNGAAIAHTKQAYDVAVQTSAGLHVHDASMCGELILEIA